MKNRPALWQDGFFRLLFLLLLFLLSRVFRDIPGHIHAAGTGVGQGVGHAAAVSDDEQPRVAGLEVVVQLHLHVIELHLHAVEQGVVVGGAGAILSRA